MHPRKLAIAVVAWVVALSALHIFLNLRWEGLVNSLLPEHERKLNVAYIPVT